MKAFHSIKLDKQSSVPLYIQLGDGLLELINNGILAPKTKLPPIRKMSNALKLNNITVINAYKYLEGKQLIYSHIGSGTYVGETKQTFGSGDFRYDGFNFASNNGNNSLFPSTGFKDIIGNLLAEEGGNAFRQSSGYQDAFFEYLGLKNPYHGLTIVNDITEAIQIIIKNYLKRGDEIFIEEPSNSAIWGLFKSRGIKVIPVPMEFDGINISKLKALLKKYKPKLIYLTTYFQNPTGSTYSLDKKVALLDIAKQFGLIIVEEDTQSELNFSGEKITTLAQMDVEGRVILVKNISKYIFPGLNMCLLNFTDSEHDRYNSQQVLLQKTLSIFLESDYFNAHIKTIRDYYSNLYNFAVDFISQNMYKYCSFNNPYGGVSLWLNTSTVSSNFLCDKLLEHNVIVAPGGLFMMSNLEIPYIRLSFGDVSLKDLEEGLQRMLYVFQQG